MIGMPTGNVAPGVFANSEDAVAASAAGTPMAVLRIPIGLSSTRPIAALSVGASCCVP